MNQSAKTAITNSPFRAARLPVRQYDHDSYRSRRIRTAKVDCECFTVSSCSICLRVSPCLRVFHPVPIVPFSRIPATHASGVRVSDHCVLRALATSPHNGNMELEVGAMDRPRSKLAIVLA